MPRKCRALCEFYIWIRHLGLCQIVSFWFQTGSRTPCNGCRITAWDFFLKSLPTPRSTESLKVPGDFSATSQQLSVSHEQIPSIPAGMSTTVSQMELSLPKKGLACGDVEQQPLQEWRKSAKQAHLDLNSATYKAPRKLGPSSQLPIDAQPHPCMYCSGSIFLCLTWSCR